MSASEIMTRMIQAAEAKNMSEMLRKMGFSHGAGTTWKKRGEVPDGSIAKVAEATGVDFKWLKSGYGEMAAKGGKKAGSHIDPALAQDIAKKLKTKYEDKTFELTGEELMAVQMLRDLSDHDRQRIMHTLQMAWTAGKVEKG